MKVIFVKKENNEKFGDKEIMRMVSKSKFYLMITCKVLCD